MSLMSQKDLDTVRELLTVYERRSTCMRLQVAAVLTRNGRVIATGWNGVPAGLPHCEDHFAGETEEFILQYHGDFSTHNEIHAECNCLAFAARHGIATEGAELSCTYSPCMPCAKQIVASGIVQVNYKQEYDRDFGVGLQFLKRCGIPTVHLKKDDNPYKLDPDTTRRIMMNTGIINKDGTLADHLK